MDSDRVDTLSNLLIAQLIPSLFTALVLSLALDMAQLAARVALAFSGAHFVYS